MAFLAGHSVAIRLDRRNARARLSASQRGTVIMVLAATPTIAWLLIWPTYFAGQALTAFGAATAWEDAR